jgi:hypothetical protein
MSSDQELAQTLKALGLQVQKDNIDNMWWDKNSDKTVVDKVQQSPFSTQARIDFILALRGRKLQEERRQHLANMRELINSLKALCQSMGDKMVQNE